MGEYTFEREARTPYSEVFTIETEDGSDAGRVDLHYTPSITYATLCVGEALTEDDIQDLIGQIDDMIIVPALVFVALKIIPKEVVEECRTTTKDES